MKIKTKYNIGQKIYTCEYSKGNGYYNSFNRIIKYIKCYGKIILYGFTHSVEVLEAYCHLKQENALKQVEMQNKKFKGEENEI